MTTAILKKPKTYKISSTRPSQLVGNDVCQLCGHCCSWKKYGYIRYYTHKEINKIQHSNKRCYRYIMNQVKQLLKVVPSTLLTKAVDSSDYKWAYSNWEEIRDRACANGNCEALVQKNGKYYCHIHSKFSYKNKSRTCKTYKCGLFWDAKDYKDNYISLTEFTKRCGEFIRHHSLKKKITVEQLITALSE